MLIDASEVARILGTSRQRVAELAATETDFPPADDQRPEARRLWDRSAIDAWAASHPDPGVG